MTSTKASERMDNPFGRRRAAEPPRVEEPPRTVAASRGIPALPLRPMTGYEEELVEEHRDDANTAALCNELLARCLVPPGADATAARTRVRSLLVAERDAALVSLRRMSLGDKVSSRVSCPACGREVEIDFNLSALPLSVAEAPERVEVVVEGDIRAVLRLPTAGDQEELLSAGLDGESLRRTFLLARTLVRFGDREGPFEPEFTRGLRLLVRNAMEEALERVMPDLDLSMGVTCHDCGHAWSAPFDVPSFFLPR
ncbi:hypothetical protein [Cystobacter ferrugineus]|uniref:Uncharacterized protein n=1 Tax=Cystobacter ferrugineus TaxID=83449 RepID=A0A1L9AWW6_9BACT|nr:hypothetical protein [Cystobacter ferrugineus]OJH34505.1 hypothetical protein BON30_42605 [Cystobacter ferrugineus]